MKEHTTNSPRSFTRLLQVALTLLLLCLAQAAPASALRIETVTQPLYLHGSDTDPVISFTQVPYVTFHADPEWRFPAIAAPFIPPTNDPKSRGDVNLVSLYRIAITVDSSDEGGKLVVTIDATKALVPEGYPFTIEQVIDAATTCVKLMFPPIPAEDGSLTITVKPPKQKAK